MNSDLGLVILDPGTFGADVGVMHLSVAGDSILEALTGAQNLAYPSWFDTDPCQPGSTTLDGYWGWWMINDNGIVNQVTQKKIGTRIDGGPGHSGSPIFYCPTDDDNICAVGEAGYVIGVWSGWYSSGLTKYNGGPKVPYYRQWILGEMP